MGNLKFFPTMILALVVAASAEAAVTCSVDGVPVTFESIPDASGSQFILRKKAKVDEHARLSYTYNPFYQIGGSVTFETRNESIRLLRWDNGFSKDIPYGNVIHGEMNIECWL